VVNGAEVERTATGFVVRVTKADTAAMAGRLLAALPVADLTIEEPPVDQVIEQVFAGPVTQEGDG
jgi:ABC-2 type transport system ATP-binding protein